MEPAGARITRRQLGQLAKAGLCASLVAKVGALASHARANGEEGLAEVMFYKRLDDSRVECLVCPRKCRVADQERGFCGNKENRGGRYFTLVHSRPCAVNVDPIEKKPFFHVLPGTKSFSIATAGCNIECQFCQNWQIAQVRPEQVRSLFMPPEEVVRRAKETGCPTISYTYSEPVSFYEYMLDTAVEGNKRGVRSLVVTNGYINEEPLKKLCENVAAIKVDLKAFNERFYKELCRGELKPVLDTLKCLGKWSVWTEIVMLILPGHNDGEQEIRQMARWIKEELSPDVPVHFTRFRPAYKMQDLPPTPIATLERCYEAAKEEGLRYVYIGNVPGHKAESTQCPRCGKTVIGRMGFAITQKSLSPDGRCSFCGEMIPGIWA